MANFEYCGGISWNTMACKGTGHNPFRPIFYNSKVQRGHVQRPCRMFHCKYFSVAMISSRIYLLSSKCWKPRNIAIFTKWSKRFYIKTKKSYCAVQCWICNGKCHLMQCVLFYSTLIHIYNKVEDFFRTKRCTENLLKLKNSKSDYASKCLLFFYICLNNLINY